MFGVIPTLYPHFSVPKGNHCPEREQHPDHCAFIVHSELTTTPCSSVWGSAVNKTEKTSLPSQT